MGRRGLSIVSLLIGGLVVLLESLYKVGRGLMQVSLFDCAVVVVGEACSFAFVRAYALYESFLLTDDFEHEPLLSLQFFVVGGKEVGEIPKVAMDFEVEFDTGIGKVGLMSESFEVVFTSSGVEKVRVFDHMLYSGRERRYESFCRLLLMGGGGRIGGEGCLSLLLKK